MAGPTKGIHIDPAMVKYNNMWVNRHKYFRYTPWTTFVTVMYMAVVPSFVGYWAYTTDGKYDMRGKRRGDTIVEF